MGTRDSHSQEIPMWSSPSGELSGIARKYVVGKRHDWLSYAGGVEHLLRHLRSSLGRPQLPELSEYLTKYFRQSRRHKGETMNSYIVRKSELYNRAKQALSRVHQDHRVTNQTRSHRGSNTPAEAYTWHQARHSRWQAWETASAPSASQADTAEQQPEPSADHHSDEAFYDASEGGFDPWRNYGWHQSSDAWSNSWRTAQPYEEDEPWTQQTTELLPDYLQGWYLLHDAGLDSHERNLIQTAVGSDFSTIRIAQELRALKTNSSSEIKPTSTPFSGIKMKDPVEKTPKDTKDGPQPHWPMKE